MTTVPLVMKMVSWGTAFKKGFVIWLWSIVWLIVSSIIAIAISGGSLFVFLTNPTETTFWASIAGIGIGIFIGMLLYTVLLFATVVKISIEGAIEEAKKP